MNCPLQVYSRRKAPTTQPEQVQLLEFGFNSKTVEVNTTPKSIEIENPYPNDLDVPISIRLGIRTCTKHLLHLFLTYKHLSPNHKASLINLDTILIPKTLSESLGDRNWKIAMNIKMEALEKNRT